MMKNNLLTARYSPRVRSLTFLLRACVCWAVVQAAALAGPTLKADVDLRDLPRRLLHARIEIPVEGGDFALWYPKWIPGIHAPGGPVQNLAGLRIETTDGQPISWRRDDEELYRFHGQAPAGADSVVVHLDYICNQPSVNSTGVDSYGDVLAGIVNFNTCLLYPDGYTNQEIQVRLRLRFPAGWRHATALEVEKQDGEWTEFHARPLVEVIDSPLICGAHLHTLAVDTADFPKTRYHFVSESPSALLIDDALQAGLTRLPAEGRELFVRAPYAEYHFLTVASDELPGMGMEHLASSLNGVGERDVVDVEKRKLRTVYLLPHEFVHAWCGKYRRPAGMHRTDYHTPQRTSLLWIYEGLTQYLGEVLAVRSGLVSEEEYLSQFAAKVGGLMRQKGRSWRSLEDTAVASYQLRARSPNWGSLRRGQDYYNEGLVIWLEADAIIRQETDGAKSLDDFCASFFAANDSTERIVPYELDEVLDRLNELAPYDWRHFFESRVQTPRESLALDVIQRLGYRLEYSAEPSEFLEQIEKERSLVAASDSLGLVFDDKGSIENIVPGMPGDQAGLAPGMIVEGVNDRKYSLQRMKDAIADSVTRGKVELLVLEGDRFRTIALDYNGGSKYLTLVRDESQPDLFRQILKPRASDGM